MSGRREPILVAVSAGELIDKITILQIKSERFADPAQLVHVRAELSACLAARERCLPPSPALDALAAQLRAVNEVLWQAEAALRRCEGRGDFGPPFVALARSVYRENDRRSAIKRQISQWAGSALIEEKQY